MTITYHEETHTINGREFFIEQYADKPHFVKYWRYGEIINGIGYTHSEMLWTKPRLKTIKRVYNL